MTNKQKIFYIPLDRATAMIRQQALPEQQAGTALFADVAGFSALAEALRRQLGDTHGAEALIAYLNRAFEALIGAIHDYGGSVIGFSGDAITCWFDADYHGDAVQAACSALMAAHEGQTALGELTTISLPDSSIHHLRTKITLASGSVQRWVLGAPAIQLIDTILGPPVERLALAERLAQSGEILADEATIVLLQGHINQIATRSAPDNSVSFGVITMETRCAEPRPRAAVSDDALPPDQLSQWLLPAVNSHFDANISELTELRSVAALFLRFQGKTNADGLPSKEQFDQFIRWAQHIIHDYGGSLLQLTLGDKGSYLYAAFGAPVSYENNAIRALSAALELRQPPADWQYTVQIGVSNGVMRAGFYGSERRHTYGVQGDEVNIAARLMMHAPMGGALVSEWAMQRASDQFDFAKQQSINIKGQPHPINAALLSGKTLRSTETLNMVAVTDTEVPSRQVAWSELYSAVRAALTDRRPTVIHLEAEAGMGKSRLTASVRHAIEQDMDILWLTAPCDEILKLPLSPYRYLAQRLLGQHNTSTPASDTQQFDQMYDEIITHVQQVTGIEEKQRAILLKHLHNNRRSLRSYVCPGATAHSGIPMMTFNFGSLSNQLLWLLRAISLHRPIVLHLNDSHALDADSQELTGELILGMEDFPIVVLLTRRPLEEPVNTKLLIAPAQIIDHRITLHPLSRTDIAQLIGQQLPGHIDETLITDIFQQCRGNPMYASLLVDHLRAREQITQHDGVWQFTSAYDRNDLPVEIQTQLIAEIDRLGPGPKAVVQAAAVLGRTFDVRVLRAVMDGSATTESIEEVETAGIWQHVAGEQYEFSHSLLRSVAYTMLGQERRRELHQAAGAAISRVFPDDTSRIYEITAHVTMARQ